MSEAGDFVQPEIEDPEALLQLILDDKIHLVGTADDDGTIELSESWNNEVNSLFLPFESNAQVNNKDTPVTQTKKPNNVSKQSHRLLTSEEVVQEKLLMQQRKEEKEKKKEENKLKKIEREIKKAEATKCSSSECERGFRHMKSLKTTFRTCLSEDSLASQMCIKLHSPSIEAFDPVPAIRLWNAGGLRRPLYMDSKERNLIRVAKQSVNSDINERIATETESHHVDEEEDYLSVGAAADKEDLVQDDENGADSNHDDQFSDNEDYGNEGRVYRVMCREGLIEE
ncbi:Hypothetical predicted protein [Mytilus galloprovincialis]|uniref:HAT C-terminal dimerisation domain-containing protein n=1 Tax=Mytilus galloprovincialis TaxID=29158 RepID=A0A8B6FW68_MYTGA|nr:Hypothetical predicted protein [Mytilus galloprovincialis]